MPEEGSQDLGVNDQGLKPILYLSLVDDETVLFKRGTYVDGDDWDRAIHWWQAAVTPSTNDWFSITYVRFVKDFQWLTAVWKRAGSEFDLDSKLRERLTESVNVKREFERLSTSVLATSTPLDCPEDLKRILTDFQKRNISQLRQMTHGADFSVPGAGKTTTSLVLWNELRKTGNISTMLVVCPRSSFEAWTTEPTEVFTKKVSIQLFDGAAIRPRVEILVINYEQLENREKRDRVASWVKINKAMVVLDEAHRVKGGNTSVRWRACKEICTVALRVELLTGTPMPQSYDDLRNLLSLSWSGLTTSTLTDSKLVELTRGGIYVRTTKDELGLPPTTNPPPIILPMGELQKHIYSALRRTYSGPYTLRIKDADSMGRRGRAAMTLIGVATNPGLLLSQVHEDAFLGLRWPPEGIDPKNSLIELIREYVTYEIPPKYDWIRRFAQDSANRGEKILVWSTFVGNLKALHKLLEPLSPALVYGSIGREDRLSEIDRFRNSPDCHVLLTNPQTLGEGISLHQQCHTAIYVDRTYNAGLYLQSVDRIHRLGLSPDQKTSIFLLESAGTIDQNVSSRLEIKIGRLASALKDPGLPLVSLPNDDHQFVIDELGDLDSYDAHDLYSHLMEQE